MGTVRLTKGMKLALEHLRTEEAGSFVAFSTACALYRRGLVHIGAQQTGGKRAFPEYWITLTATGRKVAGRPDSLTQS